MHCDEYVRTGKCFDGECEYLHKPRGDEASSNGTKNALLVISCGPERTASTWLFNSIRLLFEYSKQPVDSYWIHNISQEKLESRGFKQKDSHHLLIKTHDYPNEWNVNQADLIFTTHRNIVEVAESYVRLGWLPLHLPLLISHFRRYEADHLKWRDKATLNFSFEEISSDKKTCLKKIAQKLAEKGIDCQDVVNKVYEAVEELEAPKGRSSPDPVSKLWPNHISKSNVPQKLSREDRQTLMKTFAQYQQFYGYPTEEL